MRCMLGGVASSPSGSSRPRYSMPKRVSPILSTGTHENSALLRSSEELARVFLPSGHPLRPGDRLVQPDLAKSLCQIAAGGFRAAFRGALGERRVEHLADVGGLLDGADLDAHRPEWVEPLRAEYRGVEVSQLPPNTQGLTLLQMLNMLADHDVSAW